MGSSQGPATVTVKEIADSIDRSVEWVRYTLNREGVIPTNMARPLLGKHTYYYNLDEVNAVLRSREESASNKEVRKIVYKTDARASALEQRMDLIEYVLGVRTKKVALGDSDLKEQYLYVRWFNASTKPVISLTKILEWSRLILGLTEEYFCAMSVLLDVKDPWMQFLKMADRIAMGLYALDPSSPSVCAAQEYFDIGRKNLRAVAFVCCVKQYGEKRALDMVPVAEDCDVDEEIVNLILSREVIAPRITTAKREKKAKKIRIRRSNPGKRAPYTRTDGQADLSPPCVEQ